MKIFLGLFLFLLSGCAHRGPSDENLAPTQEITQAEKTLASARYEDALKLFREFQTRHPQSVFFESARLGEAQSLVGVGRFNEATELYRDVYLKTQKDHPEIAGLALYYMSFAYEALGDDLKMVAALLDAKKRASHLPIEIALAQIPARLATVYARQGRDPEAFAYLNEAERGITKVIQSHGKDMGPDWLPKIYVEMGSASTNQLSVDNFEQFIGGQRIVQVYLLKALKQNNPNWSSQGQQRLQTTYRDLYTLLESVKSDRQLQADLGGSFVDLMDQAELYKPLSDQKMNSYEQDFFSYLTEVRKKTEEILYGSGETMTLTEESKRLNSIKRSGRVKSESLLPLPPKIVPSEDPNL